MLQQANLIAKIRGDRTSTANDVYARLLPLSHVDTLDLDMVRCPRKGQRAEGKHKGSSRPTSTVSGTAAGQDSSAQQPKQTEKWKGRVGKLREKLSHKADSVSASLRRSFKLAKEGYIQLGDDEGQGQGHIVFSDDVRDLDMRKHPQRLPSQRLIGPLVTVLWQGTREGDEGLGPDDSASNFGEEDDDDEDEKWVDWNGDPFEDVSEAYTR